MCLPGRLLLPTSVLAGGNEFSTSWPPPNDFTLDVYTPYILYVIPRKREVCTDILTTAQAYSFF